MYWGRWLTKQSNGPRIAKTTGSTRSMEKTKSSSYFPKRSTQQRRMKNRLTEKAACKLRPAIKHLILIPYPNPPKQIISFMLSGWEWKLAWLRPPRHHRWPRVLAGFCQRGSIVGWDFQSWACSGEYKCCSILQVRSLNNWTSAFLMLALITDVLEVFLDFLGVDQLGYQIPEVGIPDYNSNDKSFECVATIHQRIGDEDRQDSSRNGPRFFWAVAVAIHHT